jgi:hypothetical protein
MAIAILQFTYVLVGSGLGPLVAGGLSDALAPAHGTASLGLSLNIMTLSLLAAAVLFLWSGRTMIQNQEE